MIQRRSGKILLIGSASVLRGMRRASTYSAARGAQLAYIQAVGVEVASQNVQVNAIAQHFVDNPSYFPADVQANPAFQERLKHEVPLGRLVAAREDAHFAAFLCSEAAGCFAGARAAALGDDRPGRAVRRAGRAGPALRPHGTARTGRFVRCWLWREPRSSLAYPEGECDSQESHSLCSTGKSTDPEVGPACVRGNGPK